MKKDLQLSFTDREMTPWGGMALMSRLLKRMDFQGALQRAGVPTQGSNRGYAPGQLMKQFLISVWCGANRFEHMEVTRQEGALRKIVGYERMAGHKAFVRYFGKFGQGTNQRVFEQLYGWFFEQMQFDNFTLDLDSTVINRYGEQEGARQGYNPGKPGRNSHHPLLAFIADCRMVANCWLRSGDAHTANNFTGFLEDTLNKLEGKKVGLLKADSGFFSKEVVQYLERSERPIPYIIAARLHTGLQRMLAGHRQWLQLDDGIEVASASYESGGWGRARRLILVRQQVKRRPKAAGKVLRLFADDAVYRDYRYGCFITSLELPATLVWRIYRMRADAENRIKELKYYFGADSFNVRSFSATEAAMNFVMIAYNLMSLFRQVVLGGKVQPTLKTMRYKVFAVGGYLTKEGTTRILKLSMAMRQREWFSGLWGKSKSFDLPVTFSSHL